MEEQLYALIEVVAGRDDDVPLDAYRRWWPVHAASARGARVGWANRMTEAFAYASRLPLPDGVRWWRLCTAWLIEEEDDTDA